MPLNHNSFAYFLVENRGGKTFIIWSHCFVRHNAEQERASKAVIFNNKGNLLCTLTEPQQRRRGRSWPRSLQMDAECFGVTVNCTLNSVLQKLRAPSGAILTSSLHPVMLGSGFAPPGFKNIFLKGARETISQPFCSLPPRSRPPDISS